MTRSDRFSTKQIVLVALLAALTCVGSSLRIKVPADVVGTSAFHLGNILCALSGILLGPWLGGLAAGLGSAIYDMLDPLYIKDCWLTFLMKGSYGLVVGLVIGWLAEKGYTLLHGKQGKGKVAILIVAILVGVALGTIGADVFTLAEMINAGEIPLTYSDIPEFLLYMLQTDSEYVTATLTNLGMGVVFAGLGVYGILKKTGKEVADTAFVDLK